MATDDPQHRTETAERWGARISTDDWDPDQCGRCAFWVPLGGRWGLDWGACTSDRSPNDGKVTHEHDRCSAFVDAGDRWARAPVGQLTVSARGSGPASAAPAARRAR